MKKPKKKKQKKTNVQYVSNFQEREIEPAEIIVAKNRNGEVKHVKIQFNKPYIRFEDIAPESKEQFDVKDYKSKFDGAVSSDFSMPRV